jgi:glutamine amidotransferase
MIKIIDYGLGNVTAFVNVYKRLNIGVSVAHSAADLEGATHLILPGVGSFDHAMNRFLESGMRPQTEQLVHERGLPLLGICVGMQMLADSSSEGRESGLGWIPGRVRGFSEVLESAGLPLPHMGWNDVRPCADSRLLVGLELDARFYFLHSYFFECQDPGHVVSKASYGFDFPCIISRENIHGVQCHPEKSHHWGVALLKNFAEI